MYLTNYCKQGMFYRGKVSCFCTWRYSHETFTQVTWQKHYSSTSNVWNERYLIAKLKLSNKCTFLK